MVKCNFSSNSTRVTSHLFVAEPPNLMSPRSTCLSLDTKYLKEDTKLRSSVEHTQGRTRKSIFFHQDHKWENKAYNILAISYITFHATSEYNIYCYKFNLTAEYKHVIRITAEINIYSWNDEALVYRLWQ